METGKAPRVPRARIKGIEWGSSSYREIMAMSVAEVTQATRAVGGVPVTGGLSDARMGTTDRRQLCSTCGNGIKECQGHFGHCPLPLPVVNVDYITHICWVLQSVCYHCSRVMLREDNPRYETVVALPRRARLNTMRNKWKMSCPDCVDELHPTYSHAKNAIFVKARFDVPDGWKGDIPSWGPRDMYEVLCNIPDEDLEIMGLDARLVHPRNWMWRAFIIPEPITRPNKNGSRRVAGEDDITVRLKTILKDVQKATEARVDEFSDFLTYAEYVDAAGRVYQYPWEIPARSHGKGRRRRNVSASGSQSLPEQQQPHEQLRHLPLGGVASSSAHSVSSSSHPLFLAKVQKSPETVLAEAKREAKQKAEARAKARRKAQAKARSRAKAKARAEAKAAARANAKAKAKAKAEAKALAKAEARAKAKTKTKTKALAKTKAQNKSQPKAKNHGKVGAKRRRADESNGSAAKKMRVSRAAGEKEEKVQDRQKEEEEDEDELDDEKAEEAYRQAEAKRIELVLRDARLGEEELERIVKARQPRAVPVAERDAAIEAYWKMASQIAAYHNKDFTGTLNKHSVSDRKSRSDDRDGTRYGRIRNTMAGKRVNQVGRSVITPDPYLSVDQIGLCVEHCMRMTYPEPVNARNIVYLTKLVRHGPNRYPGANEVERTGIVYDLESVDCNAFELKIGDIVHRHLSEEMRDIGIYNRQPTLHDWSMIGGYIQVNHPADGSIVDKNALHNDFTYRIDLPNTVPLNGDFDGDTMNFKPATDAMSRAEAEMLLPSRRMIKNGSVIIRVVMNAMMILYRLGECTSVPHPVVCQCLMAAQYDASERGVPPKQPHTGRAALSYIIPRGTFVLGAGGLVVRDGVWESGLLTKKSLNGHKGLLHVVNNDLGCEACGRFLDRLTAFALAFASYCNYSFTMADVSVKVSRADLPRHPELMTQELRKRVHRALEARGGAKRNDFLGMVESGTKGSAANIGQLLGMLGPQLNAQSEMPKRGTSHHPGGPVGVVRSSFVQGMSPTEMNEHHRSSRIGLLRTAVSTMSGGYLQRRLAQWLKTFVITEMEPRLMDHNGRIMQMVYADGYSADVLECMNLDETARSAHAPTQEHLDDAWRNLNRTLLPFDFEWKNKCWTPVEFERYTVRFAARRASDNAHLSDDDLYEAARRTWDRVRFHGHKLAALFWTWCRPEVLRRVQVRRYLDAVERRAIDARIQPGTSAGMRAAQDIGEDMMQKTLNEFHKSGMKSTVGSSITRMSTIMDLTKTTPNLINVFFADGACQTRRERHIYGVSQTEWSLKDLVKRYEILADDTVRFYLDRAKCVEALTAPSDIYERHPSVFVDFSLFDADDGVWYVDAACDSDADLYDLLALERERGASDAAQLERYVSENVGGEFQFRHGKSGVVAVTVTKGTGLVANKMLELEALEAVEKVRWKVVRQPPLKNISMAKLDSDVTMEDLADGKFGPEARVVAAVRYCPSALSAVFFMTPERRKYATHLWAEQVESLVVAGRPGVLNFAHGRRMVHGKITHFVALHCVEALTVPEVMAGDPRVGPYTYSSNIRVMYESFGMDVARASIVREASDIYGQSGNCIQSRHFHVVADSMIMFGELQPCSSKGVRSVDDSVMRNASFEHANEVITSSSALGTVNDCDGPSDRIIMSRPVRCGSNYCETKSVPYRGRDTPLCVLEQPPFAAVANETLRTMLVPNDMARRKNLGDADVVPKTSAVVDRELYGHSAENNSAEDFVVHEAECEFVPAHLSYLPRKPFAVARFHQSDTKRVRYL